MKTTFFLSLVIGLSVAGVSLGNDPQVLDSRRHFLLHENITYVQKRLTGNLEGIIAYVPLYNFKNMDLRGFNLKARNFWLTDFEGANLSGAQLQGASFLRSTKLRGAVLRGVNFERIYINHSIHSPEWTKNFFRMAGALVD